MTNLIVSAALLLNTVMAASAAEAAATAPTISQTYYFLVFNSPAAGKEAEYNWWYNGQHAPDVVSVPGFVSAQRFVYNELQLRKVAPKNPRYLVMYKIVTDDLPAVLAAVKRRLASGETRNSNALDPASGQMFIYRALRPAVAGARGAPAGARPGPMTTYFQMEFGDAPTGTEDEFNIWYDNEHAPGMVAAAGVVMAQRGIVNEVQMEPLVNPARYLALFRIDTTDLAAVFRYRGRGAKGGKPPPAIDPKRTFAYIYKAIGPPLLGDAVRAARARASQVPGSP